MKTIFIFSCSRMFRDVPECSGVFHVPGFIDALLYQGVPDLQNGSQHLLTTLFSQ